MVHDLKPYSAYKGSGVPWLGEVPEDWNVLRGRYLFREIDQRSTTGAETHLSMSQRLGLVPSSEVQERRLVADSYVRAKLCEPDDLVLNRLKAHLGVFAIAKQSGLVSQDYTVFRRASATVLIRFFESLLKSPPCRGELQTRAKGLVEGFWRLYTDDFYAIKFPVPPVADQSAIVRFLDHADRRIRRHIRAKQKLITLLQEQKQAIIQRAVTHGLDSNVRLKPSGVEWVGDVPEHWDVARLKTIVRRVTSGSRGWSNFAADHGALFIRIANLTRASIDLDMSSVVRLSLPGSVLAEASRTRVEANDLLLSITAFIGSVAVVPKGIEEAYVSQHVACCKPRKGAANARWVAYVLLSSVGQVHGRLCMYGGTKQGLSLDDVKNYVVLLPSADEQAALVRWIETECANVHRDIDRAQREIGLLWEYRTRLIADVVTGKLDVRGAAASLPTEADEPEGEGDTETDALNKGDDDAIDGDLEAALEEAEPQLPDA